MVLAALDAVMGSSQESQTTASRGRNRRRSEWIGAANACQMVFAAVQERDYGIHRPRLGG